MSGPYGSDISFVLTVGAVALLVLAVSAIVEWLRGR